MESTGGWVGQFVRRFCYSNPKMRPGFAAQGAQHVIGVGDEGFFAAAFEEVEHGFDLGFHA